MKVTIVAALLGLIVAVGAAGEHGAGHGATLGAIREGATDKSCYSDVGIACDSNDVNAKVPTLTNCNAKYGAIENVLKPLQKYVNSHIVRSFEYLLLSTHFANYEANRPGFEKLYRSLSDSKWHDAIDLIKLITKRGGKMDFSEKDSKITNDISTYELYEIQSLAKALDIEKSLATEAFTIHKDASRRRDDFHDPQISSYLEKEFMHEHAENVRKLSGYTNDLKHMLVQGANDASLALYLFDDYLLKQ